MDENFDLTYKALFRRYYPSLIFYATRLVGEEEAEDVEEEEEKAEAVLPRDFYRDRCRKNMLDTGEDRISQRLRRSQKIRTNCQS